jgi:hypothetical protein
MASWRFEEFPTIAQTHGDPAGKGTGGHLAPPATMRNDLDWLRTSIDQPGQSLVALVEQGTEAPARFVAFVQNEGRLPITLGWLTLWSARVRRFNTRDLCGLTDGSGSASEADIAAALTQLRQNLPRRGVLFLESVPVASVFTRAFDRLARSPGGFTAVQYGETYAHRYADLAGAYDAYLSQLGAKTRADLRRTRRRFEDAYSGRFELFVARSEPDIPRFVTDASKLALKTWQHALENGGLADDTSLQCKLEVAARRGCLRSYILYVDGEPIAFQVGYLMNGTFDAHTIGYDPDWHKSQPGILLHTFIVEDLLSTPPTARVFDFGTTDRLNKARLSTRHTEEAFFFLIPRTLFGRALATALRTSARATALAKRLWRAGAKAAAARRRPPDPQPAKTWH